MSRVPPDTVLPAQSETQAPLDPRSGPGMTLVGLPEALVCETPLGAIGYRQAGVLAQTSHVLLHGIGSGSASWLEQLAAVQSDQPGLLAWDAPGYGQSDDLALPSDAHPDAGHYADRLWAWLDALGVEGPLTLVGHSLGALMAARAAAQRPERVARLVLLAPARGYARASAQERQSLLDKRLGALASLGPAGMAQKRAAAMLTPDADPALVSYVQAVMAEVRPQGYTHAARLLAGGDLLSDLLQLRCTRVVASGHADGVTPPEACQQLAVDAALDWIDLGPVGHACPLQAPGAVNALLGLGIRLPGQQA